MKSGGAGGVQDLDSVLSRQKEYLNREKERLEKKKTEF
jgi:hypothetical protein